MAKPGDKFKTEKTVFDAFTKRTIFKLQSQGHLGETLHPVLVGKEANVFYSEKDNQKIIVKIYRLETCDFNRMYDYIRYDPRFVNIKRQRRQVIFAWVQKEYRNLLKAREAGVRVPTPHAFLNNCLVMEFIGDNERALQLKQAHPVDPQEFFDETVNQMRLLFKAGLIHGDLSPFNILNFHEKPVLIDFSQTTTLNNINAKDYFNRDIKNMCNFFRKQGLEVDDDEVKKRIVSK